MVSIAEKTESLLVSDGLESSFTSLKKKKNIETSLLDEDCELRVRELEKKSNK
jgi:translation initiation factor 2 subunit 2